jgi:hypothetical protein
MPHLNPVASTYSALVVRHGPERSSMLTVSRTYLEMPVIIHEFCAAAVPPEQLDELTQINPRARLHVTRLPPDQLNPEG